MSSTDSIVPDLEKPILYDTIDDIDEFDQEVASKKRGKGITILAFQMFFFR